MAESFNGYDVYEVVVNIKGLYTKEKRNHKLLKFLNRPSKPVEMSREITKLVVASSKERAIEKYKESWIYPEVGELVSLKPVIQRHIWDIVDIWEESKITEITHEIKIHNIHSLEYLCKNLTSQDFVQYMTYLGKGFNELIEVNFNNKEEE